MTGGGERGDDSRRGGDRTGRRETERERRQRADGERRRETDRERRERIERAEARRRERRARAAAANRDLDRGAAGDAAAGSNGADAGPGLVSTLLRFAAFALLTVGFLGLTLSEAWLSPAGSPYAPVFGAGVACAIVSIYLEIYRHDG